MPKVNRKKVIRKRYKKKKKRSKLGLSYNRKMSQWTMILPNVVTDVLFLPFKYTERITMTNVSGTGTYVFSMNSLYDPNVTGTGHQPLGFDQWANFYDLYEVIASKIEIEVLPPDVNLSRFVCYPSSTATPLSGSSLASEQPYAKHIDVTGSVQTKRNTVKNYMYVSKMVGRKTYSVNYTAAVTTSPAEQYYWQLIVQSHTGTAINDIAFDVTITYYSRMFGRKVLSQS